jgi:hypothetical protein
MITEEEKELYNTYLIVSRSSRNKPFKTRKNFDGFEETKDYMAVKRLYRFLLQFPQIKPETFFKAPFKLYKDVEYINLNFYNTQKAVKAYTTYMKQLQEESPDSEHHIDFIKRSLRYIGMFCIKNKIPIEEYPTYSSGVTYTWMKHVRDHSISIYVMFYFTDIFDIIYSTLKDELDLLLGNVINNLSIYKNRFNVSKTARHVVNEGFNRIKRVVDKGLNK